MSPNKEESTGAIMAVTSQYMETIDTIFPDGYQRETVFRDEGDMVEPAPKAVRVASVWRRWIAAVSQWQMKRQGRLVLRELDDSQLRDIGVTREEAMKEVKKSLFIIRPPS
jgi:uncharacterized protein YjiS (DUF1127 family)